MGVQRCQQESLGLEAGPSQWPPQTMPPSLLPEHLVPETLQVMVSISADHKLHHVVCTCCSWELVLR